MILARRPRALIFDFDGVLADTEDLHWAAFHATLRGRGIELPRDDYYRSFLGLPDRDCLLAVCRRDGLDLGAADGDELVRRKRAEFARLAAGAPLYPGVAETLGRLRPEFVLAVASGAFRDEIESFLVRGNVRSLFAALVGADDVAAGKPAPDPYLEALRRLNASGGTALAAAECLAVEDSPRGVEAAHAAGMPCVAVTTSHARDALSAADALVEGVCDLRPELLGARAEDAPRFHP